MVLVGARQMLKSMIITCEVVSYDGYDNVR